jgi:hypothetical protein
MVDGTPLQQTRKKKQKRKMEKRKENYKKL